MVAPKASFTAAQVKGRHAESGDVIVKKNGVRYRIPQGVLTYSDARAVAKAAGATFEASGYRDNIALHVAMLPETYHNGGEAPQEEAPQEAPQEEAPQEAPQVPQEAPSNAPSNGGGESAEDVLDALVKLLGLKVDVGQVEDIARRVAAEATAHLRPTVVKVGDRPEVQIKGRPHYMMERILKVMSRGMIPWLHGPAGTGKSTLARHLAEALTLAHFGTVSGAPMMSEAKLFGFVDGHGVYKRTPFRDVVEFGGVYIFDEFDHAPPAIAKGFINEILAAKAGDVVSFPDGMVVVHKDCNLMLAANTSGGGSNADYDGNKMDESTMSRVVSMHVDYDLGLEEMLAEAHNPKDGLAWHAKVKRMRANIEAHSVAKVSAGTRLVVDGAQLLDLGWSESEAFDAKLGSRLSESQREKVLDGITLS